MATKVAISDPVQLQAQVDAYLDACAATRTVRELRSGDVRVREDYPSMVGLASYIGICADTLYTYMRGDPHAQIAPETTQAIADVLSRARDRIGSVILASAMRGDCDSRIALSQLAAYGIAAPEQVQAALTIRIKADADDVEAWSR
jgi:hypothetical protein